MRPEATQRLRGLEKNRLESLIDGVFAVALTLLVLDIRLPEDLVVANNDPRDAAGGRVATGMDIAARIPYIYLVSMDPGPGCATTAAAQRRSRS